MVSPILELTNINKSFGHVHANKDINLTINKGTKVQSTELLERMALVNPH